MSRVGKKPISIPADVKISYKDRLLTVTGGKSILTHQIHPAVDLEMSAGVLNIVALQTDRPGLALQGLVRSLINNMVVGVSHGFQRTLEIKDYFLISEVNDYGWIIQTRKKVLCSLLWQENICLLRDVRFSGLPVA